MSRDDKDNMRIYILRRLYHMPWGDMATKMNKEDADKGILNNWTHPATYNRWMRNSEAIHKEYFPDDKGFNFLRLKYQKRKSDAGQKRKKTTSRVRRARVDEKEEERDEEGDENGDEDEEMAEQQEKDHKPATAMAADDLSAQPNHANSDTVLDIPSNDLVALHICQQQALDALKPEVWRLMAEMMNERAAGDESEDSSKEKTWSASDCEAAMKKLDL
jgi:hypothetical protein